MIHAEHHLALILSVLAVFVGPLLLGLLSHRPRAADGFRWLILAGVGLSVAALVLPECLQRAGMWAAVSLLLGLLLPGVAERVLGDAQSRIGAWLLVLPLVVHALLHGVALSAGAHHDHGHAGHGLIAALVLHRLPEGLGIWCLARKHGRLTAVLALGLDAVCCAVGFYSAAALPEHATSPVAIAMLEAFVGGVLLHVFLERPGSAHAHVH